MMKNRIALFYFTLCLGSVFLLWGAWAMLQTWLVDSFGEEKTAVVLRTWRESSQVFDRTGKTRTGFTNHAEIALLDKNEPTPKRETQDTTHTWKRENLQEQLATRAKERKERLDSMLQAIKDVSKSVAVPAHTPRYTLHNLSDAVAGTLFQGKKLQAKHWGRQVQIEPQYANGSEQNNILLVLGGALVVLAFVMRFIGKK